MRKKKSQILEGTVGIFKKCMIPGMRRKYFLLSPISRNPQRLASPLDKKLYRQIVNKRNRVDFLENNYHAFHIY